YNLHRGIIDQATANAKLDSLSNINNLNQIKNLFYRNAYLAHQTLSISGGSEQYAVYGSLTYTDDHSSTPGDLNKTYKVNVRQDFQFNKRLHAYLITDLTHTTLAAKRPIEIDDRSYPYMLFKDMNGNNLPINYMTALAKDNRKIFANQSGINLEFISLDEFNRISIQRNQFNA